MFSITLLKLYFIILCIIKYRSKKENQLSISISLKDKTNRKKSEAFFINA